MTWVFANSPEILELVGNHLALTMPAIALAVLIAVPAARLANMSRRFRGVTVTTMGLLYTIPSLPLLILIPVLTGIPLRSPINLVIAMTIYGVALLVRTASDAFAVIPAGAIEAAEATGYSRLRRIFAIELPLALPVLIAGIRVVAMSTIGLATIGALVGISSLGSLFTDGFQRGIAAEVVTGVVLTLAIAVAVDLVLVGIGRVAQPWRFAGAKQVAAA